MATIAKKSFASPDERRTPPNTEIETVTFGDRSVQRITYHPGWHWTMDIKPVAGTDLCQINHFGYVVSGQLRVKMDNGTEVDMGPGDVMSIPAGHDAWVIGDAPFVSIDFGGAVRPA